MFALRHKSTARFDRILPAGFHILAALDMATSVCRVDLTIACGSDGHPPTDPHTLGEAYDVSVARLEAPQILQLVGYLRSRLGPAFYLQYETPSVPSDAALVAIAVVSAAATAPHIHIQRAKGTMYPPSPAAPLNA